MIVLDTTVLVYAVGTEHRYRAPCRAVVSAIREGRLTATTTVEAIQEFAHVRAKRRDRSDAADLARAYRDLLSPLMVLEEHDLTEGLQLFVAHDKLGSFDAVLAAAAMSVDADALVSTDSAFAEVSGLRHVVPDEAGAARLLGQDIAP